MRTTSRTSQFKRDVKRMQKRGRDLDELGTLLRALIQGEVLPDKHRDHLLVGQHKGTRECHVQPDWLLLYEVSDTELTLIRTGTHADLFE